MKSTPLNLRWTRPLKRPGRRAFTLMELTVVLAVLGVVAVAASSMLNSRRVVDGLHAQQEAHLLTTALRTARATAIANEVGVRVSLVRDASGVGYSTTVEGSPNVPLQPFHSFPEGLNVDWSRSSVVFTPAGMTDGSLFAVVASPTSTWVLDVLSASGQVIVTRKN